MEIVTKVNGGMIKWRAPAGSLGQTGLFIQARFVGTKNVAKVRNNGGISWV